MMHIIEYSDAIDFAQIYSHLDSMTIFKVYSTYNFLFVICFKGGTV